MSKHLNVMTAAELARPLQTDEESGDFKMDDQFLTVRWGNYDYNIELRRIDTPAKAIAMIGHMALKTWRGMTPNKIGRLIRALSDRFDWPGVSA